MCELPKRKRNRLAGFDYSSEGMYFITVCTKDRCNYFWQDVGAHIVRPNDKNYLSEYGEIAETAIKNISAYHKTVFVDKYVIMPNHIHLILILQNNNYSEGGRTLCAPTVSLVIRQMKEYVTKQIGFSLWQKSFHDHVIRNDKSYKIISEYIENNPFNWEDDQLYIN